MTDYTNDIKRYLNGEMTPAEMQALEKKALSDSFLAEALEGASQLPANQFSTDVAELDNAIDERTIDVKKTEVVSKKAAQPVSSKRFPSQKITLTTWAVRIAAALLLLVVATVAVWQLTRQTQEDILALNESETQSPAEVSGDEDKQPPATVESATPAEQAGPLKRDETGSGSSNPAAVTAKPAGRVTEEKPVTGKTDQQPVVEMQEAPVPAEKEKANDQAEQLPVTEKAAEFAVADKQEEGKLLADDRKKVSGVARSGVRSNQHIIKGKVTSLEDGSPLPGVNVVIKDTNIGTVTDASGNYQIESDHLNPSLVFSFIGLQSQELAAGERKQVDVQLAPDAAQLSEVVVTGYGIQRESYIPTVELAHPVTGNRAFKQYLERNVKYPKEARDKKIEGRVTIEFFVETNGALSNFEVIRGVGAGCDEELIRLVREGPKWEPTKRDGVPVRDKARVRLKFDLPRK